MTDRTTTAGYLAFPDFHTAVLWYNLFGRPNPPTTGAGDGEGDEPTNPEDETGDETNGESGEGGEDGSEDSDGEQPTPDTEGESEGDDGDADLGDDLDADPDDGGTGDELSKDEEDDHKLTDYELTDPTNPEIDPRHRQIIEVGKTKEIIQDFDSWADFVECVRQVPQVWSGKAGSREAGREDFNGTRTWDEAISMARETGWPEGRELLRDLSALVIPRPSVEQTWDFDVAGSHPLVPMFCAGDPACFVTDLNAEHRAARPIVRIDLHRNVPWYIPKEAIITRGAAMLSFANTLERLGYSTELRIVQAAQAMDGTNWVHRANITFKRAGEVLDLDRAAFAIAHPSTYRRLIFALYEQHAELKSGFTHGYGRPMYEPNDPTSNKPGGAIWIPAPAFKVETPETAQQAVEDAARLAGFGDLVPSSTKLAA